MSYRTQKAQGFYHLQCNSEGRICPIAGNGAHVLMASKILQEPGEINEYTRSSGFARPCPVRPRHGFVDSRPYTGRVALKSIFLEAKEVDPEAELIIMPFLSGKFSGIITPNSLTIGQGHAGATAGTGSVHLHFPGLDPNQASFMYHIRLPYYKVEGTPFIEVVEHEGDLVPVQIRSGPKVPGGGDFIPKKTQVKEIIKAEGDLLEWETRCKEMAKAPGTVVWHPKGSMASHYAIHCVINNIPCITQGKKPKLRQTLMPTTAIKEWQPALLRTFAALFARTYMKQRTLDKGTAVLAMAGAHGCTAVEPSSASAKYLALALNATIDHLTAACVGEGRHWNHHTETSLTNPLAYLVPDFRRGGNCHGRDEVYRSVGKECWHMIQALSRNAVTCHAHWSWYRETPPIEDDGIPPDCGYGGPKWAACAEANWELVQATSAFLADPSLPNFNEIRSKWNNAIYMVHNGGRIMNKWIMPETQNQIAACPLRGLAMPEFFRKMLAPLKPLTQDEMENFNGV